MDLDNLEPIVSKEVMDALNFPLEEIKFDDTDSIFEFDFMELFDEPVVFDIIYFFDTGVGKFRANLRYVGGSTKSLHYITKDDLLLHFKLNDLEIPKDLINGTYNKL